MLYAGVPPSHQVQLHQRIAGCLEKAYGKRANEIASELARHWRNTNEKDKAIHYLAATVFPKQGNAPTRRTYSDYRPSFSWRLNPMAMPKRNGYCVPR